MRSVWLSECTARSERGPPSGLRGHMLHDDENQLWNSSSNTGYTLYVL